MSVDGPFAAGALVSEPRVDCVGMANGNRWYLREDGVGLLYKCLPQTAMTVVDTMYYPDGGVARLVQQGITKSLRRRANLPRELDTHGVFLCGNEGERSN